MPERVPNLETSQAMQRVLAVIRRADRTADEIPDRAYVSIHTLTKGGFLKAMVEQGLIHIHGFKPPARSGNWAPIYRAGKGKNAKRPGRAGNTEYARRWRAKNPEYRRPKPEIAHAQVLAAPELKKVRRQAKKITAHTFTLAGLLGL